MVRSKTLLPDSASIARAAKASAPLHLALMDSLSPVLPPRTMPLKSDTSRRPAFKAAGEPHPYDFGPSRFRYVPGITSGFGGTTLQLSVIRTDPVGRLGIGLMASGGSQGLPMGFALEVVGRDLQTAKILNGWASRDRPHSNSARWKRAGCRTPACVRLERMTFSDGGH